MKQVKIPGFRPGKIPESVLVGFVGEQNVKKATVESILKRTLPHAMTLVTGRALRDSVRIVTKFSEMEKNYSSLNSLSYDVLVDVAPEVKWNPETGYKNLKIVVEIDNDIAAQQATEEELRRRHKSLGSLKIVTDRGLQVGDVAIVDISVTTIDEDESNTQKIPDAEGKGFHFDTDGDKVLPGFLMEFNEANMKLNGEQLAALSSPKAVKEFRENQRENITNVIKQNLAVRDIFKCENLQFSTEDLVKEVENSIAELKQPKQEYDEDRVREQVQDILEGAKVLEWLRGHAEIQYITR